MSKIMNASNTPLNQINGTVPDISGALRDYFQPMTFTLVTKTVSGFQVVEDAYPIELWGVIQPLNPRQLILKPEGQRAWSWYQLHAQTGVALKVDDCIEYQGRQYRVMAKTNYVLYGYDLYELVTDWTGAGP